MRSRQLRSKNSLSRSGAQAVASLPARCGFAYAIHRDPAPPATFRFVAPCEASKPQRLRSCRYQQSVIAATSCACALPAYVAPARRCFSPESDGVAFGCHAHCHRSSPASCDRIALARYRPLFASPVRQLIPSRQSSEPDVSRCRLCPAGHASQAKLVRRDLLSPRRCHVLSTGGVRNRRFR